jgi:hypothetical protein
MNSGFPNVLCIEKLKSMSFNKRTFYVFSILLILAGCKVNYSFTGASVAPDVRTLSITTFPNYAPLGPPSLSQVFTESLKDIFIRQTSLALVKANGDLMIEGEITDYRISSEAVSGNDQSKLNKLTMTVKVRYTDTKDETKSYEQTFSNFAQFGENAVLSAIEDGLITEINQKINQDIFNKSLGDW